MFTVSCAWWFWMFVMFMLFMPVGYGWGYRGWGAPVPSYVQRQRMEAATRAGHPAARNHLAWCRGGDCIWALLAVELILLIALFVWRDWRMKCCAGWRLSCFLLLLLPSQLPAQTSQETMKLLLSQQASRLKKRSHFFMKSGRADSRGTRTRAICMKRWRRGCSIARGGNSATAAFACRSRRSWPRGCCATRRSGHRSAFTMRWRKAQRRPIPVRWRT